MDFGLAAKVRPALVVSVDYLDHERALLAVVPHTTSLRGPRFEIQLSVRALETGAFDAQGIRSILPSVLIRRLTVLPPEQLREVDARILRWLGQA